MKQEGNLIMEGSDDKTNAIVNALFAKIDQLEIYNYELIR